MADAVQEIKDRISIEDLVGQYVQLKKVGRNLKGLCPFHSEKTPSFIVSPERQIAYCFGCNKGGDIFTFIQEIEGVDFNDALKILAEKTGVKLDSYQDFQPKITGGQKDQMIKMCEYAASFYERNLWETADGEKVIKYLINRGLTENSIRNFRIGFAPDSYEKTYKYLISKGFTKKILVSGGLAVSKETTIEKVYDRFRGRLMFPILDGLGRVVAFGGRALSKDQEPKYLNSPETAVYHKSNVLYGFYKSKQRIKEKSEAVIVEGYFDVIASNQAGVLNAVASCGTALASKQLRLLKPFAENIILAFDMDFAGQEAAKRAFELAQEFSFNVKVAALPEGKDPADYVKEHGPKLLSVIDSAVLYGDFLYDNIVSNYGTDSLAAKKRIIIDFIPYLNLLRSNVEKDEYVRRLALDLNMKEVQIYDEIKNLKLPDYHPARSRGLSGDTNPESDHLTKSAEEILLGLILQFPRVGKLFTDKIGNEFFGGCLKAIYKVFIDKYNSDSLESEEDFINVLPHELKENAALITLYVEQKYGEINEETVEKEIAALIENVRKNRLNVKRRGLQKQLAEAERDGNKKLCGELLKEISKIFEQIEVK